jgi:hypothetical protein
MANESQSVEKTEQELFEEVSAALAAGKNVDSVVRNVSISGPGTAPEQEETPEPLEVNPPEEPAEDLEEKEADGTEVPEKTETEPVSPALPPEVQERIAKLERDRADFEHKLKSDLGRIAALQRQVAELSRAQAAPQTTPKVDAATPPSVAKSKFDEKIAQVRNVDPELADLLVALKDDVTEPLRKELTDKVSQTEHLIRQREEQEYWHKEKARLLEMVPQADEVFRNPMWKQWKEAQPDAILALASSANADEMYLAMRKFAEDTSRMYPHLAAPAQPATQTQTAAPASAATNKVVEDRARKLASTTPATTGASPKQGKGIPDESDPQAMFNYVMNKIEKGEPIKF